MLAVELPSALLGLIVLAAYSLGLIRCAVTKKKKETHVRTLDTTVLDCQLYRESGNIISVKPTNDGLKSAHSEIDVEMPPAPEPPEIKLLKMPSNDNIIVTVPSGSHISVEATAPSPGAATAKPKPVIKRIGKKPKKDKSLTDSKKDGNERGSQTGDTTKDVKFGKDSVEASARLKLDKTQPTKTQSRKLKLFKDKGVEEPSPRQIAEKSGGSDDMVRPDWWYPFSESATNAMRCSKLKKAINESSRKQKASLMTATER